MNALRFWFCMLIGLLLSPIVLVIKLVCWPFDWCVNMSAETLANHLRNELSGGGDDDLRWEDLEQIKRRDPYLEDIRNRP
jgi:hypothetical protein